MATSGSKDFSLTRNDIINSALRKLGEYDKGETPSGDETADASEALNILINEFAGVYNADIFLRAELTLFIQKGQESYLIGPTGDNVTESYAETTLTVGESDTDTVLAVVDSTGMTTGDYVGVKVDDGSIHWTTVTVDSAVQITLAVGIDDDAAAGNEVYAYTTKAYRPHGIYAVLRRDPNDLDNQIGKIGEQEYFDLTDKDSAGVPNSVWYRASLDDGKMFVWPTGDGQTDKLVAIAHYYPDDFDAASDTAQFPIQWTSALIWGLAAELGPEYGLPDREQKRNLTIAAMKREAALDSDIEDAPVQFARAGYQR
jgi:hypothetical protein